MAQLRNYKLQNSGYDPVDLLSLADLDLQPLCTLSNPAHGHWDIALNIVLLLCLLLTLALHL